MILDLNNPTAADAPLFRAKAWFEEHPGEIALKVRAANLGELFMAAGEALAGLMLPEGDPLPETAHEMLVLEERDRAALLVAWLTELIGRAEISNVVFTRFEIRVATEHRIEAAIHGVAPTRFRNPVKAATYHRLAVDPQADGGYVAAVILDV
jgi:SHS2 domain-containing protein